MSWGYGTIQITSDGGEDSVREAAQRIAELVAGVDGFDVEIELVGVEA